MRIPATSSDIPDIDPIKPGRQAGRRNVAFAERLIDAMGVREQAAVARNVGVSPSTIGDWRKGSMPAGDKLLALADELGVEARWLGSGEGPRRGTDGDDAWVALPRYDLDEFTEYGKPAPIDVIPVRREWLGRRAASPVGLWLTTMPAGAPEIAAEGDTILCQDVAVHPMDGSAYVVMLAGRPLVRRLLIKPDGYELRASRIDPEPIKVPPDRVDDLGLVARVIGTIGLRHV